MSEGLADLGTGRAWDDGADVEEHPLVARARRLAADLLAPAAATVDRTQVSRSSLDAIGRAGLLGLHAVPAPVERRVSEVLSGADLTTWFVAVQHAMPLGVAAATRREPLTSDLASGRLIGGVAFAHLRRGAACPLTATRTGGGWRFDGTAPWYTGWGINDVALVGARAAGEQVVFALVPARAAPGLTASQVLDVAAVRGARTVSLAFDGVEVRDDAVLLRLPAAEWDAGDAARSANVIPAAFGVAESALVLLAAAGNARGDSGGVEAAASLQERLGAVRRQAYRLADTQPGTGQERADLLAARLDVRARALRLVLDATSALVTVGAGGAMAADAPAQRHAREALFLLIQAQTAAARARSLRTYV